MGWVEPMYTHSDAGQNVAYVLLMKPNGPAAYIFQGTIGKSLAASEEEDAEGAVEYLVRTKKVIVDDVNLERFLWNKACSKFYRKKKAALEFVERIVAGECSSVAPESCSPRTVSIDFWEVWLQIVVAYELSVAEVEDMVMDDGTHISTLVVNWLNNRVRVSYFLGEKSPDLKTARNSLAKKVIGYVQTVYGFHVRDANFSRMICADITCSMHRERYLAVKETLAKEVWPMAILSGGECATPEGPEYQIRTGLVLPPPPKQRRTLCRTSAGSSLAIMPDDPILDSLFLVTAEPIQPVLPPSGALQYTNHACNSVASTIGVLACGV